eukprot:s4752_g1.t1
MLRSGLSLALCGLGAFGTPPEKVGRLAERKQLGSFAPAPAPQTLLENVTVQGFQTKVLEAVNQPGLSAYVAVVYFHLPSCAPCHEMLPVLRQARARVEDSARSREVILIRPIRIFVLDCSQSEAAEVCERFAQSTYPAIRGFRQGRLVNFNRPRERDVIAWWMARIARPSFFLLDTPEHWKNTKLQRVPSFLLLLADSSDQESVTLWEEIAIDNLEQCNFYLALHSQGIWKFLPGRPPSVHVSAHEDMGLDAAPFQWVPDKEVMQNWLEISLRPPVSSLGSWNSRELLRSGLPVVVLRHGQDETSVTAVTTFRERVNQELRATGQCIFATLDVDTADARVLARSWFPLVGKNFEDFLPFPVTLPPEIFVFTKSRTTGEAIFWYSPEFPAAANFTLRDVEELVSRSTWFHDNSGISLAMQTLLRFDRFGARSPLHRLIWLCTPFCVAWTVGFIWRGLCHILGLGANAQKAGNGDDGSDASSKSRKARKGSKKTR